MKTPPITTLDKLVAALHQRLGAADQDVATTVRGVRTALENYDRAVEADRMADFARRNGLLAPPPDAVTRAADALAEAALALPGYDAPDPPVETTPPAAPAAPEPPAPAAEEIAAPSDEDAADAARPTLVTPPPAAARVPAPPRCPRLAGRAPVLVVGGEGLKERPAVLAECGLGAADWVALPGGHSAERVCTRIASGRYGAVAVVLGLTSMSRSSIIAACKTHQMPWCLVGGDGTSALRAALDNLESLCPATTPEAP